MARSLLRRRLIVFPCALIAWSVLIFFIEDEFFLSRLRFGDPAAWQTEQLIDGILFLLFMIVAFSITGWPRLNKGLAQGFEPTTLLDVTDYYLSRYNGFAVSKSDFKCRLRRGPTTYYRVNSDGGLVNLQPWHFDQETGEFHKIKKTIGSQVIVAKAPYSKRLVQYHSTSSYQRAAYIGAAAIAFLYLFKATHDFGITGFDERLSLTFNLIGIAPVLLAFATLIGMVYWFALRPKSLSIGPEPLKRKSQSAQATSTDDATDDLEYPRKR